jgi:hypothetical protein
MSPKDPDPSSREGRTAWHVLLTRLLQQRAPSSFRVLSEVPLSKHPLRLDLLLLRRQGALDDSDAAVLRDLWRRILRLALLEYKSPSKPLRRGELAKLLSYAFLYAADHPDEVKSREDLLVVLVLPSLTAMLPSELAFFGWTLRRHEGGYHQVQGALWPMLVLELDVVSQAERDELLGVFGHGKVHSRESLWWWQQQTGTKMAELAEMEGYDEVVERFVASLTPEQRLAGLAPEQRLAGLAPEQVLARFAPEQRLAGLAPEQVLARFPPEQRLVDLGDRAILALPDHLLALLPDEALAKLPDDVRDAVRKRLGR